MTSMSKPHLKHYGQSVLFDPEQGTTIIGPQGEGKGWWAGAPSVVYDDESLQFYLYYRVRKPRPVRGGECHIASSKDGIHFETIWSATKEDLGSPSLERFSLTKRPEGGWILYPSYVDPVDNRWRIDVVEADDPASFDLASRKKLLTAGDVGVEGVKDPWVMNVNGLWIMLISYAVKLDSLTAQQAGEAHATADIYNTGLTLSSSALAVSGDGINYDWQGDIFCPAPGQWDAYCARLCSIVPTDQGWLGFYDGAASVDQNYEEITGLVQSWDLRSWYRLTPDGPALKSPNKSGGLRYVDVVPMDGELWIYYEYCRPDGSHELRLNKIPW